ncbi:hypothetical protein AMS68_007879 [Peltaster fructicola]|uniref:Uncharacterized protein n=1 Tax=Peltaster fructicola TaxID=286661 RepID=A0A6H0Y5P5_9PEZI|nr:hypothetical protein AMS68_007879 [Peltaster fructicola]
MDILAIHALGTASWLTIQALPLLFAPSLITTLLSQDPHRITDLETYLCRSLGLILISVALLQFLLTGLVPLRVGQRVAFTSLNDSVTAAKSPYQRASLTIITIYFALAAFYAYTQVTVSFSFAFAIGLVGDTALFALGLWVLLFGNEKSSISKSTGADKRTSNYPFENKESAKEAKKREKEKERDKDKDKEKEKDKESRSSLRRSILKSR